MNEVAELRLSATYTETDICSILLQYVFPHLMLIFVTRPLQVKGPKKNMEGGDIVHPVPNFQKAWNFSLQKYEK